MSITDKTSGPHRRARMRSKPSTGKGAAAYYDIRAVGHTYHPPSEDEVTAEARARHVNYLGSTTINPTAPGMFAAGGPEPWVKDAADECRHGRLPGDKTEACGCWPESQPTHLRPAAPVGRARRAA